MVQRGERTGGHESVDYELRISAPKWRMTPEENEEARERPPPAWTISCGNSPRPSRRNSADKGSGSGMGRTRLRKIPEGVRCAHGQIHGVAGKIRRFAEAEEKIAKEMGWLRELTDEEAEAERQRIEEMNRACEETANEPPPEPEPHREGIDWIRTEDGDSAIRSSTVVLKRDEILA